MVSRPFVSVSDDDPYANGAHQETECGAPYPGGPTGPPEPAQRTIRRSDRRMVDRDRSPGHLAVGRSLHRLGLRERILTLPIMVAVGMDIHARLIPCQDEAKSTSNRLAILREDVAHHLFGHGAQFRWDTVQGFRLARGGTQGQGDGFQETGVWRLLHQFG